MSSLLYNATWQKAQAELRQLVKEDLNKPIEPPVDGTGDAPAPPPPEPLTDRLQVIDMLRLRFIKYSQIIKNLNECYDQIVHPQKRILLRRLLDGTIGRLLEIKKELVNLDCSEFHYFDDILQDLNLTPHDVETPVPKYFLQQDAVIEKLKTLQVKMNKFNIKSQQDFYDGTFDKAMSLDEALAILQKHERARQGILRAKFMLQLRKEEERNMGGEKPKTMSDKDAANVIGHWYKQIIVAKRAKIKREEEFKFIGMTSEDQLGSNRLPALIKPFISSDILMQKQTEENRRFKRTMHQKDYESALVNIKEQIHRVEGPDMKEQMKDVIRQWFMNERDATGKFPEYPAEEDGGTLKLFVEKTPEELEREQAEAEAKAEAGGGKGKKGKKGKGDKKGKKGGKGKKGKGKGGDEEESAGWKPATSKFLDNLDGDVQEYEQDWRVRDESNNFQQKQDDSIIKAQKTREVENEIRVEVDALRWVENWIDF